MAKAMNQTMAWVISVVMAVIIFGAILSITSHLAQKNFDEKHANPITSSMSALSPETIANEDFTDEQPVASSSTVSLIPEAGEKEDKKKSP